MVSTDNFTVMPRTSPTKYPLMTIVIVFSSPRELVNEFRHHHLGVLEEMVDATQHKVGLDNVSNILQQFNIEKVFDMKFGLFVLQGDFCSNVGH